MQPSSNPINNEKGVNSNWKDITNNYEYLYEIETEESVITLEGKSIIIKTFLQKRQMTLLIVKYTRFMKKHQ